MKNLLMEERIIKMPNEEFEKRGKDFLDKYIGKSFKVELRGMEYSNLVLSNLLYLGLHVQGDGEELKIVPIYGLSFTGGVELLSPEIINIEPNKPYSKTPKRDYYTDMINNCEKKFYANKKEPEVAVDSVADTMNKYMDKFNKMRSKLLGKRVSLTLKHGIKAKGQITDMTPSRIENKTFVIKYQLDKNATVESTNIERLEVIG